MNDEIKKILLETKKKVEIIKSRYNEDNINKVMPIIFKDICEMYLNNYKLQEKNEITVKYSISINNLGNRFVNRKSIDIKIIGFYFNNCCKTYEVDYDMFKQKLFLYNIKPYISDVNNFIYLTISNNDLEKILDSIKEDDFSKKLK